MNEIRTGLLLAASLTFPMLGMAAPANPAPWSKAFVIDWYEPAFYYGAKEGVSAPGTDCPAGTNPEMDWRKVLKTSYRTDADVDKILDPENPGRAKVGGIRGPNKENVYQKPWAVPDPGLVGVSGDVAEGFDLDGDKTTGLKGLKGEPGIDNEYYRAIGCFKAWRGPSHEGHHAKYVNDGMRDGRYTLVMVVSGVAADWRNDDQVQVGFYQSTDKMVKDANGAIAHDYTFRINPDKRYQSVVRARTVNGVVETAQPVDITTRSLDRLPLILKQGRLRFEIQPDGKLVGLIGGYRSIDDYYTEWAAGGAIFELTMHINVPAYWYALQRSADGLYDEGKGRYTGISSAFRIFAVPAFVVSPDASEAVTVAKLYEGEAKAEARPMRASPAPAQGGDGGAALAYGPGPGAVPAMAPPEALPPQLKARPRNAVSTNRDSSDARASL